MVNREKFESHGIDEERFCSALYLRTLERRGVDLSSLPPLADLPKQFVAELRTATEFDLYPGQKHTARMADAALRILSDPEYRAKEMERVKEIESDLSHLLEGNPL